MKLNLDAYRAAVGEVSVTINGVDYPLKRIAFIDAVEFGGSFDLVNLGDADAVKAFVAKLAELSGIPLDVLAPLLAGEVLMIANFFISAHGYNAAAAEAVLQSFATG